tara:strand:- start:54 stop:308 length:255 start_codon:yes stop_codon:yes gene_type:complete
MVQKLRTHDLPYHPAIGPLGDLGHVFRRLGGISRLDVVFSMIGVGCVAFWSCLRKGKSKAVKVSMKPAVYLLTYIPSDTQTETV